MLRKGRNVSSWHNVRAQLGAFEGTKAAALPTLGIKGQFTVYGAGLEPMSALVNSTFDRAGAANGGSPPTATDERDWRIVRNERICILEILSKFHWTLAAKRAVVAMTSTQVWVRRGPAR
jgi:hypothetical protein